MNKFERGKRAEFAYDDIWIHGDDGHEIIIPPEGIKFKYKQPSPTLEEIQEMIDKEGMTGLTTSEQLREYVSNYFEYKN